MKYKNFGPGMILIASDYVSLFAEDTLDFEMELIAKLIWKHYRVRSGPIKSV